MEQPDKLTSILLDALRKAMANPTEHRLFKSGKVEGIFSRRGGGDEAAALALREGYVEIVRREEKGKTDIEWVHLTPRGIEFLYEHDSPQAVLGEIRKMLRSTKAGVPAWLDAMLDQLKTLAERFGEEMQRYLRKLDVLTHRVEEALRRIDAGVPALSNPIQGLVPWGWEALTYLDHRKLGGAIDDCPLQELFGVIKARHPNLSIILFHDGLRQLEQNRAIRLLPFLESPDKLPAPEYALLDGSRVLYYAKR
jgi:hypothetical protein